MRTSMGRRIGSLLLTLALLLCAAEAPARATDTGVEIEVAAGGTGGYMEGTNTSRNMACGPDGTVYIVYKTNGGSGSDILLTTMPDGGNELTQPVKVAAGSEAEIAVSSTGRIFVVCDGGDTFHLYYSDNGVNFHEAALGFQSADAGSGSMHLATDGNYVYAVPRCGHYLYRSENGGETFTAVKLTMPQGFNAVYSDVLVDNGTHKVVVVEDNPHIYYWISEDHGATFSNPPYPKDSITSIYYTTATCGDGCVYVSGSDDKMLVIDLNANSASSTKANAAAGTGRSISADDQGNLIVGGSTGSGINILISDSGAAGLSKGQSETIGGASGANVAVNAATGALLFLYEKGGKLMLKEFGGVLKGYNTVRYNANGGAGAMAAQDFEENAKVTISKNAFTRAGYVFTGWNTAADGSGTAYKENQTVQPSAGMTLYAQWEKTEFIIHYDANGGTGAMADQKVNRNVAAALTANAFTRTGYRFVKWNTAADGGGTDYTDRQSVTLTNDLTLYAQWEEITATVTYHANGGAGEMADQKVTRNVAAPLTPNAFTRAGYTFEYWNTKADGSGADYADGQSVTLANNLELYAIWSPCITLHANDGSGRKLVQNVVVNTPTTIQANPFARTGATFLKWNTAADGSGTDHADRENVGVVTENLMLYAQWRIHEYTVRYSANGGTGEMEDQAFTYGTAQRLRPCGFNNGRLRFAGWALSMDGAAAYSEQQTVNNLTAADGAVVTLYAVWRDDTPDARVSVWQGNQNFGAMNGKLGDWYHFDMSGGLYNVVTQQGTRTVTTLARVGEEGITDYAAIPSEPVNSVLVVGAGTPDIVVGGLDAAAYEGYRGGEVTLTMTVSSVAENMANAQHNAIRAVAKDRQLEFYDLSLSRTVGGVYDRTFYGETEGNIQIYFPLHGTSEDIEVYRWHDGVVETIPFNRSSEEYAAVEDGYLMVSAKKFSAYAVGYPMGQCPRDYRCPISAYPDASTQAWYHDGVHWALAEGAMVGLPDRRFAPNDDISRAQIVVMLWRLSGCPYSSRPCPFTDAQGGHWFSDAVRWAADEGIVKGRSETIFDPDAPVTREELAAILYRYTEKLGALPPDNWWLFLADFADSDDVSDWAYEAVNWAAFSEIFVGALSPEGSRWLNPQGNATRAQTATVFMRWWEGLRS